MPAIITFLGCNLLGFASLGNAHLPRLRVLHAHALAALDCRVAQVINVGNRDAGSRTYSTLANTSLPLHHSQARRTGQVFVRGVHARPRAMSAAVYHGGK